MRNLKHALAELAAEGGMYQEVIWRQARVQAGWRSKKALDARSSARVEPLEMPRN